MAAFSSFPRLILRTIKANVLHTNNKCALDYRLLSYLSVEYGHDKRDPAPLFFLKDVQLLMKSLTRPELEKIFRKRKTGEKNLDEPAYKFLTEEELQESFNQSHRRADELLQIPPVVKVRREVDNVLSRDPALTGLETSRMVFTDISFGLKDTERTVVVREPDGTLREAEWSLRERVNQIYFPKACRQLKMPKMFEEDHLKDLLNRKEYEYILDRACLQFEPNDPEYQRVTSVAYQHVNDHNDFDLLRSTRHFGSLVFFLVWNKAVDNLLLDLIETDHMSEVKDLLTLYGVVHEVIYESTSELNVVKEYIKKFSNKKGSLDLALQAYCEMVKQKKELEEGIKTAHGIS